MKEKKNRKAMTLREKVIDNVNVILSAYAIAFVIRLFLIEAYQIPSQSMVPSLLVGDILMVEKVTAGPKLPIVNLKVPGLLKPKRNDVIVFVHPGWKSPGVGKELISLLSLYIINLDNTFDSPKNLVKRLVGLPGDKIMMTNQVLVINGEAMQTRFVMKKSERYLERMTYVTNLSFNLFEEKFDGKSRIIQHFANGPVSFRSEEVEFSEIRVPRRNEVISLTNQNSYYLGLLKLLVERESGKMVMMTSDKLYLEGKLLTEWKVKDDYYFAMGDNRDFSEDCRYFGFIPASNIFGRPLFRYFPFSRFGFDVNEKANTVPFRQY